MLIWSNKQKKLAARTLLMFDIDARPGGYLYFNQTFFELMRAMMFKKIFKLPDPKSKTFQKEETKYKEALKIIKEQEQRTLVRIDMKK